MRSGARLLVVPCYLVVTLVLTWPLARELGHALPVSGWGSEVLGGPFLIGWVLKALAQSPTGVFDLPIFHPEPLALAYTDHLIGEALLAAPVVAATGNLAVGYNVLILFSFVASAWAVYRLARLIGVSRAGAFLAGFLFAFAPFRFSNLTFLNQIQTQFIPLGLFFALRFVRGKRTRDLVGATATLVVQSYFGWYYTFYLALAVILLVLYAWAVGWLRRDVVPWKAVAWSGVAAVLLVLPGLLPYLELRREMLGYQRSLGMTAMYSADLLDYLKVNRGNWLLGWWPSLTADLACWPGLVTVPLALLGFAWMRRSGTRDAPSKAERNDAGYFAWLGGAGLILSLGPVLHIAGKLLSIPLPYAVLYYLFPGLNSLRGPARLAVLALLAAVVIAGIGYDRLARRVPAQRAGDRAFLFAVLLGVAVVSSLTLIPRVPFPHRSEMPPVYEWLADQPGDFAILELPVPPTESEEDSVDVRRQFYILYHGRPRLDGVSGFVPPAVSRLRVGLQLFPSPETLHEIMARGARYLVVHLDELEPELRSEWLRMPPAPGLVPRVRYGADLVVELDAATITARGRP